MTVYQPQKNITSFSCNDVPAGTTEIDLSGCEGLKELTGNLPEGLKTLNLESCKALTELPELPEGLEILNLESCKKLKELPNLPSGIDTLNLESCEELKKLPKLPEGLKFLNLKNCKKLKELPKLPEGLKTLNLGSCKALTELPELPEGLKDLNLSGCEELTELPDELPKGLEFLDLSFCKKLTNLPKLPEGLKALYLESCEELKELPELPEGLETLDLWGCKALTELPDELPKGLKILNLLGCKELKELPNLPEGLETLNLSGCKELTELPDELPKGLKFLDLRDCKKLKELPNLPSGIDTLDLSGCKELTELPKLPEGLKDLNLSGCKELTELPDELPKGLEFLNLNNCKGLKNTPALIEQLTKLEEENRNNPRFKLIWPDHIDRNKDVTQIKRDLAEAYRSYYQNDESFKNKEPDHSDRANYPTLALFHRFMSESVSQRGGMDKVIKSIITVVQGIKNNPQILKYIDEVSRSYLDACINQPVAGFTEVANLVNISQQKDIPSKLEAARTIGCIELIKSKIAVSGVGAGVEVELANAMLMKVHEKLLSNKDISKEWPGVPDGVAYEGCIEQYLTNDNIYSIYKQVKKELKKPLSDVANSMCEHSWQDFWMSQVLTKEEMKSTDEIIKLKEDICNEQNGDKLVELAAKLEQKEAESREGLLRKSKEETSEAIDLPSGSPFGGKVGQGRCCTTQ